MGHTQPRMSTELWMKFTAAAKEDISASAISRTPWSESSSTGETKEGKLNGKVMKTSMPLGLLIFGTHTAAATGKQRRTKGGTGATSEY